VSGRGTIWSFVVPHPPLLEPFSTSAPYNVIVVALDEDPTVRLIGNLVDENGSINTIDPATIIIGEAVHIVFETIDDDISMPRWARG
jgi:uncharacterized OB-fold protein